MLHVVSSSPFAHTALKNCLDFMQPEDQLLLIQDAVIACTTDEWCRQFQNREVYAMQDDLLARGLNAKEGNLINMADYVDLVVKYGSPLCW
ncbi:sulfur relay protein TusB/DsrH [Tolumonas auensis DSM 9187]|jgi:tRNA 2-thiouridine synthesizing protein B|uniref:Sulfur relay protein TusB/DsrH n=1 Tax=Tolumonas auensis (strain DSM 9187 / NBRC 110442 / TA 4) TaxID=595494 RepID=C4LBU7_TOLAT|nr:sulfurtransferase complex subunit TusB [Tolumonas auensis]ACQ94371.1 sulfur relay protein TusB/DsrH [Tolumonas auensis DSM 9187]